VREQTEGLKILRDKNAKEKEMDKNKDVFDLVKEPDYNKAKERVEGRNYAFCGQQRAGIV